MPTHDDEIWEARLAGSPLVFGTLNLAPLFDLHVDLVDQIRAGAAQGFDAVSLDIFSLRAAFAEDGLASLRSALDETGLWVLDVTALAVSADDEASRAGRDEVVALADLVDPAYVLAKLDGQASAAGRANLWAAAEALEGRGTRVVIEPSPFSAVPSLAAGLELLAEAPRPGLGLVLDSWHFFLGGEDPAILDSINENAIAYVQLADGVAAEGPPTMEQTLHDRQLPGEGELDLGGLLATLAARGWHGPICEEVLSRALRQQGLVPSLAARASSLRSLVPTPPTRAG